MKSELLTSLRPALVTFAVLSVLTGLVYPLIVTGIGQAIFGREAAGSLIYKDGKPVGSELIGQAFKDPKYFWSRPSATSPMANNASSSSGSNLGPLNTAWVDAVRGRVDALKAADPGNTEPVPVDLVTASASGLDPHISAAAALYQAARIARVRGLPQLRVRALAQEAVETPLLGLIGEQRVNVLKLNLALDALQ